MLNPLTLKAKRKSLGTEENSGEGDTEEKA